MKFLTTVILAASASIAPLKAQAPDPEAILEGARLAATVVEMEGPLKGNLVQGRKKIQIAIFLKGKNIQFQFFENNNWVKFHMRLGDDKCELFEFINGKQVAFPREKLTEAIAGTDLTYEDLALRFFYWPNPKMEGIADVAGQKCFRLRLDKPKNSAGRYEGVYVWIHTKFGAFMKIKGHDKNGTLVKEFQVEDVMKVGDDVWFLKKMQVATHDPKNGRRISITDLTFSEPAKGALKGLN